VTDTVKFLNLSCCDAALNANFVQATCSDVKEIGVFSTLSFRPAQYDLDF